MPQKRTLLIVSLRRLVALNLLAFTIFGCSRFDERQLAEVGNCTLQDEVTLQLTGHIDSTMQACVELLDLSSVSEVIVASIGGEPESAMQIGDLLARPGLHVIVDGSCNSSCANYWLPLASTITVKPESSIILHGSIDPGHVIMTANRFPEVADEFPEAIEELKAVVSRQDDYAARHGIPRGWLLYREDYTTQILSPYLAGELNLAADAQVAAILAERTLIESCIPNASIELMPIAAAERAASDDRFRRRMNRQGVWASGSLRCVEGEAGKE